VHLNSSLQRDTCGLSKSRCFRANKKRERSPFRYTYFQVKTKREPLRRSNSLPRKYIATLSIIVSVDFARVVLQRDVFVEAVTNKA
jgi:hypothetical protein